MLLERTRITTGADEGAARAELRRQVGRLERELAAYPRAGAGRAQDARLLGLAELERVRDELLDTLAAARAEEAERTAREDAARARLRALLDDPGAHRHERITLAELGEPGCGAYRARPRLGLLGRLRGWWVVKLSSGCPLPPRPCLDRVRPVSVG